MRTALVHPRPPAGSPWPFDLAAYTPNLRLSQANVNIPANSYHAWLDESPFAGYLCWFDCWSTSNVGDVRLTIDGVAVTLPAFSRAYSRMGLSCWWPVQSSVKLETRNSTGAAISTFCNFLALERTGVPDPSEVWQAGAGSWVSVAQDTNATSLTDVVNLAAGSGYIWSIAQKCAYVTGTSTGLLSIALGATTVMSSAIYSASGNDAHGQGSQVNGPLRFTGGFRVRHQVNDNTSRVWTRVLYQLDP